ncbi:ABC transporter substrate-binding protein [Lichenibacterium minor]|uniref:ABC transporter substrate-binding protein n=2 Tax=Lichenibacterium minor TaxID=2316528 RepID=A0A4Q2U016_9HYPH|nr:ABC transporter substrate-binding protein [Lichenibacterium minor]
MRSTTFGALLLAGTVLTSVGAQAADGIAKGDTSGKTIAFSNSYAGNSFRQVMIRSFEETGAQAAKDHLIKSTAVVSANNSVTEQASQIQNLILQGYSAIVVLAGSDTALNGVVKDACDAGIVVVAFASGVTEPCAYRVDYDLDSYGKAELDYLAGRLGQGPENLLEIRGAAGDGFDKRLHAGVEKAMKDHPTFKIVNEVYGAWTSTVAQKEVSGVLPSLPKIDGVLTQGGDGYGAAMAFEGAGRPLPIIVMGNRQDELALWKKQHQSNGYETMSLGATPSVSQVAFWVAQQILAGKQVPKFVEVPLLRIDQGDLDAWLAKVPEGGVVNATYDQPLVADIIDANVDHKPLPGVPAPK